MGQLLANIFKSPISSNPTCIHRRVAEAWQANTCLRPAFTGRRQKQDKLTPVWVGSGLTAK
eukprot:scaffold82509_cov22-Tisochrysis_lutea.AAC.1